MEPNDAWRSCPCHLSLSLISVEEQKLSFGRTCLQSPSLLLLPHMTCSVENTALMLVNHLWCSCFVLQWHSCCTHWREECANQRQCNRGWGQRRLQSVTSAPHYLAQGGDRLSTWWAQTALRLFTFLSSSLYQSFYCGALKYLGIISICSLVTEQL